MRSTLIGVGIVFVVLGALAIADDEAGAPGKRPAAGAAAGNEKPKQPEIGRLPAPYGKIGLSSEQKEKIYAAQKEARAKLDPIEEEIAQLREQIRAKGIEQKKIREKLNADIRSTLTESQQKQLDDLLAKAKARAEKRKAKANANTKPEKPKNN